ISNVTGGPDLSLVEVSEASSIVQEAAHEDANIIFGAVVDPTLVGKVKITVIATGFGPQTAVRPAGAAAQTPVDMTPYAEQTRARADAATPQAAAMERMTQPRLSIARRPLLDLPLAAAAAAAAAAGAAAPPPTPAAQSDSASPALDRDMMRPPDADPEIDLR